MMDQEITTCPQCGATVHPPARFCVTCGIKLPASQTNHQSGESVDPRAGWNSADMSGWTTPPPGAFEFEDPSIIDVEPVAVTTRPPVSRWGSWPSQPERTVDASEPPVAEAVVESEDVVIETTTPAPQVEEIPESEPEVTTAAAFEYVESVSEEPAEPEAVDAVEAVVSPTTDNVSEELTAEITPVVDQPIETTIEAVEESIAFEEPELPEFEENAADDFEPAGWNENDDLVDEIAVTATEQPNVASTVDEITEDEPMVTTPDTERANALLEELHAILTRLASEPEKPEPVAPDPEPSVDLAAIKAAVVEARGEISFDNFAALRATIDEAATKPRDVEVMLKLSQRVDDIVALIAERDRLQLGFDAMLDRLDNESIG